MRQVLFSLLLASAMFACTAGPTELYRNALTGEECDPDPDSFRARQGNGNGGHNSPTGIPGDNLDDEHSGRVDCYYDGDSGQGNDTEDCVPPGCDAEMCCEAPDPDDEGGGGDDPSEDPDDDGGDDGDGDDGCDGGDDGGDDGGGDDGGGDDGEPIE